MFRVSVALILYTILNQQVPWCQGRGTRPTIFKYTVPLNKTSASTFCRKTKSSNLPFIRTIADQRALTSSLRELGIRETWLDSSRVRFDQYQWVDGSAVDGAVSQLGLILGHSCGAIDLALGTYDFLPCSQSGLSHLCEIKDCAHCTDVGLTTYNCIADGSACYVFNCGVVNWYDAEVKCRNMNGTLAIVKDEQTRKKVTSFWDNKFLGPCSNSWIGIQHETWTCLDATPGYSAVSLWATNEPKDGKDCLILSKVWDDYLWKSARCDEAHDFVCQEIVGSGEATTLVRVTSPSTADSNPDTASTEPDYKEHITTRSWTLEGRWNRSTFTTVVWINGAGMLFTVISVVLHVILAYHVHRSSSNTLRSESREERTAFLKERKRQYQPDINKHIL